MKARHIVAPERDPYEVLGAEPSVSDEELKRQYHRLVAQSQPNDFVARGLPKEFAVIVTAKLAAIQEPCEVSATLYEASLDDVIAKQLDLGSKPIFGPHCGHLRNTRVTPTQCFRGEFYIEKRSLRVVKMNCGSSGQTDQFIRVSPPSGGSCAVRVGLETTSSFTDR